MSRSKTLFQLQQYDSQIDNSTKRINEINTILNDSKLLDKAIQTQDETASKLADKTKLLNIAETAVEDHALKIDQNQKKLYGGHVTNPKDLEDLQLESVSLNKYLLVLEERQLEAMLEKEEAQQIHNGASMEANSIREDMGSEHKKLIIEKESLERSIIDLSEQRDLYLSSNQIPDLPTYNSLRKSAGGLAVAVMVSDSCNSCGANIPSAVAQEARSPKNLAFCPTCKRILHPG
jgi:predicted  nucleic acid-binding Zn-ribbon protein